MKSKDECSYDIMDASLYLPESRACYIGACMMKEVSAPSSSNLSEMIFQLSIDNQSILVKCATLFHFKDTVFANQSNDIKWILEHMFELKDGTS